LLSIIKTIRGGINMKKVAILVAAIAFTVSINTKVFATGVEDSTNKQVNPTTEITETQKGIMPDSMFYFIDKAFDNLKLFLTFDDVKKEEIITQIANERSAEYESMTVKEKHDLAQNIIKELEKLSEKLDVLDEDKIENDVNIEHKEAVAFMVEKRHELNAARKEYQAAKVALKHAEKAGDQTAIDAATVNDDAYIAAKEAFKKAFEAMKETVGNKEVEETEEQANIEKDDKTEEVKEVKEVKDAKEVKEAKEAKEAKEVKEAKEAKEAKEVKVIKEAKIAKEAKEIKEAKEVKNASEVKKVEEVKIEVKERLEKIEIKNETKREAIDNKLIEIQKSKKN